MSNDRFVEVTRRGYFQRLAGSFAGIAIGFILVVASVPLLWWNEGRAVKAQRALDEATRLVVDIDAGKAEAANNGKLVHVGGDAVSHSPVRDGDLNSAEFGTRMRGSGRRADQIEKLFEVGCRRAGIGARPRLSTAAFRRPHEQLSLFG
jgi:hypothetical protein